MADAVVSIALERLADVVQERIQEEVNLVTGVKREVRYLSAKLKTIRNVLDDAESRRYKDKTVHSWLKKLEDLSYDIDNVLDEWNFAALKLQIEGSVDVRLCRTVCPFISSSCLCFNKVAMRRDIAKKIKSLKERLNEKDEFGFVVNQPVVDPRESTRVRSVSLVEVSDIHGRGDDQESLTSKLIHEAAGQQGPQVISIVGCEEGIIKSQGIRVVAKSFKELYLWKKVFLLVLDDVWTEDYTKWEPFRNSLNYGATGSKILVTTRSERVARMMGTTEIHRLGQLSDIDCWLLMKRVAFHGRSEADYEELQEIGKKIADKCKGLPLAAKVLGSLLRFKDTKKASESVLESEIWQLEEAEDWVIDVEKLIRMWMDLCYLSSTGSTNEDLELKGKEYFNNLRLRSFFQDIKEDGDDVYCKMHDIVHDFARFLRITGSEESDGSLEASNNKSSQAFRLSLVSRSKVYHSLFCQEELSGQQIDFLTFLRVLRLCPWQDIPRGMEKLIHLRRDRRIHELKTPLQYRMYQSPSDSSRNRKINWHSDIEPVSFWKRLEQIGILEGVGPTEWISGAEDQSFMIEKMWTRLGGQN
ncbi:putative disease resistance protein RGA3 [Sesamum angolense]|uniref:Disease resistance protein RGA3 n=1 Tax=Sesamum angolense TaxID=2727404 RepID=A0AAE2BRQ5_9LAMI|nr:putative disease resistance protein RGA3 [Sesamum angolense]